jgi:hypothetical protein
VKLRVPVRNPSGIPPVQSIRAGASNTETRSANARFGNAVACRVSFSPSAIRPSILATVEFYAG